MAQISDKAASDLIIVLEKLTCEQIEIDDLPYWKCKFCDEIVSLNEEIIHTQNCDGKRLLQELYISK